MSQSAPCNMNIVALRHVRNPEMLSGTQPRLPPNPSLNLEGAQFHYLPSCWPTHTRASSADMTTMCVCVKTQQRTRTGPDHRQDTTANGRRRGPCVRTRTSRVSSHACTPSATAERQDTYLPVSHVRRKPRRVTRRSTSTPSYRRIPTT